MSDSCKSQYPLCECRDCRATIEQAAWLTTESDSKSPTTFCTKLRLHHRRHGGAIQPQNANSRNSIRMEATAAQHAIRVVV